MKNTNNMIPVFFLLTLLSCQQTNQQQQAVIKGKSYYLTASGNDAGDGSKDNPWKTIGQLNNVQLHAGDTVYFKAGEMFQGNLIIDSFDRGNALNPVVITSYGGTGNAIIDAGNNTALTLNNTSFISVKHLNLTGAGRKQGNTKDGLFINHSHNITVDSIDVQGFQKSGLLIYISSGVHVTNVTAHDNGFAGICVAGEQSKNDCRNIYIGYCKAENNPGDPTNLNNHSGNGIIVGLCRNVTIEYSTATNNGWDMPRKGNGPVGIWCYEADSVTIQNCISYRNRTSPGSADGGGYDFDGGTTNSTIQYCLSYENEGSAFGLFQYAGASNWYNNTVRFCISENDGTTSEAQAGVFIWNSSRDTAQLKNCYFYNNTIYNDKGAAIKYAAESENSGFNFYNNIFVAKDELITGIETNASFLGNNWWSLATNKFNDDGITSFESWAHQKGKEQLNSKIAGFNTDPHFRDPGHANITDPLQLKSFFNYSLTKNSVLKNNGLDLQALFNIYNNKKDFNQQTIAANGIGACL